MPKEERNTPQKKETIPKKRRKKKLVFENQKKIKNTKPLNKCKKMKKKVPFQKNQKN